MQLIVRADLALLIPFCWGQKKMFQFSTVAGWNLLRESRIAVATSRLARSLSCTVKLSTLLMMLRRVVSRQASRVPVGPFDQQNLLLLYIFHVDYLGFHMICASFQIKDKTCNFSEIVNPLGIWYMEEILHKLVNSTLRDWFEKLTQNTDR